MTGETDAQASEQAPEQAPAAAGGPSDDDLDEVLKLMGVSVHYLETVFLKEVEAAGLERTVTIGQLEGLEFVRTQPQPYSHVGEEESKEEISALEEPGEDDTATEATPKVAPKPPPLILSKGTDVLCPIDGQSGAAYVHCLLNTEGDCPVGFANVLLLYANQYSIGDILDTLGDYCATTGKDPKETFVWMYCFSANLHRVKRVTEEEDHRYACLELAEMEDHVEKIKRRILNIGHVMPLLSPWKDPILLKRCWCNLELYATQEVIKEQTKEPGQESSIQISIAFPPSEKMDLETNMLSPENNAVFKGGILDQFYNLMGSIKVQYAQTTLHQDKNGILQFVEEYCTGRPQFNLQCNSVTRHWYREFMKELENLPQHTIPQKYPLKPLTLLTTDALAQQYAHYFEQLAILFENNEEPQAAEEMKFRGQSIQDCLQTTPEQQNELVPLKPLTFYNSATRLAEREDWDGAILALGKTMAVYEAAFGNQHIATGTVYHRIGDMLLAKSKTDPTQKQGAMIAYKRALDVQEAKLGKYHPVTCANFVRLGIYLETRGKFDEALEYYTNGQQLLGTYTALAVKPFWTLEKKFLLKGQDEAADLARQKGQVIRDCLGIVEPEPEPQPEEQEGSHTEETEEQGANQDEPPAPMEDLEDEEDDSEVEPAPQADVQDLLAEFHATMATLEDPKVSDDEEDMPPTKDEPSGDEC